MEKTITQNSDGTFTLSKIVTEKIKLSDLRFKILNIENEIKNLNLYLAELKEIEKKCLELRKNV